MAQCKPQERILASALALGTGRLYRLRGNIEMAQTYERRGEKILRLMVAEAEESEERFLGDVKEDLLSSWECCSYETNPLCLEEWQRRLIGVIDRKLVAITKEIEQGS